MLTHLVTFSKFTSVVAGVLSKGVLVFFIKLGEYKLLYFSHIVIFSIAFHFGHKYVENSQDLKDLMTIAKYRP